jgi:hypothetical protein
VTCLAGGDLPDLCRKGKHMKKILLGAALLAAVSGAQAAGVGARVGTTGVGADVAFDIMPTLSARFGYSGGKLDRTFDDSDISYDGTLSLSNTSALLDFAPLGPLFRISGGLVYAKNKVDATGVPNGNVYVIDGKPYNASDVGTLNGQLKGDKTVAPYLGIGFGRVSGTGINFYADFGVMFQGGASVNLTASCGPTTPAATCDAIRSSVAQEQQKLQDDVKAFKYWPVANIGVTVGF